MKIFFLLTQIIHNQNLYINFQNGKASLQKFLPDQRTNIRKWFTTRREEIFFALKHSN